MLCGLRRCRMSRRLLLAAFVALVVVVVLCLAIVGTFTGGSDQEPGGLFWSLCVVGLGLLLSIAANHIAAAVERKMASRLRASSTFFANHDLTRAVGQSLRLILLDAADPRPGDRLGRIEDAGAQDWLRRNAGRAPDVWDNLSKYEASKTSDDPDLPASVFGPLFEGTLWTFVERRDQLALPADAWIAILRLLDPGGICPFEAGTPDGEALIHRLNTRFGEALWEYLKDDFVNGGHAAKAMDLLIASTLLSRTARMAEGIESLKAALADLTEEWHQHQQAVLDALVLVVGNQSWIITRLEVHSEVFSRVEATLARMEAGLKRMEERLEQDRQIRDKQPPQKPVTNLTSLGRSANDSFTGREKELEMLRDAFAGQAEADVTSRRFALIAEGGIGKSQLAQRFAEKTCAAIGRPQEGWNLFDAVWWIDGSTQGHGHAIRKLAAVLGIEPLPTETEADLRRRIASAINDGRRHLVIVDNLERIETPADKSAAAGDPWAMVRDLAVMGASRMLITSRDAHLPASLCRTHRLEVLSVDDARTLLATGRADLDRPERAAAMDAVTEHLGRHALAVDLAGAWLRQNMGDGPEDLLASLRKSDAAALKLLNHVDPPDEASPEPPEHANLPNEAAPKRRKRPNLSGEAAGYARSVAATLALHMDALAGTDAERVLYYAAFAAPDGTPARLLAEAAKLDWDAARDALRTLAATSIIRRDAGDDGGSVSVHRLTQMVVRARLDEQNAKTKGEIVGRWLMVLVALYTDVARHERYPARTRALALSQAVLEHAERAADFDADVDGIARLLVWTARLRYERAQHLHVIGDLTGAEEDIQQAIDWGEGQTPRDERSLAVWYATRARIRRLRGDLAGAEADIERAIDWGKKQTPRDERSLAIRYATRAGIRRLRGNLTEAEADIQRSIDWGERQTSPDERSLAIDYAARAAIRRQRGDLAGAEADIERAIDWGKKQTPRDERSLAIRYAARAGIRRLRGDLTGAEEDIEWAIDWGERQTPRDERSLAVDYATRAAIRRQRGDLTGAEKDIQWAIDWGEKQTPRDERSLAIRYATRAAIRRLRGDLAGAEKDIEWAIDWGEKQTPRDERSLAIRYAVRAEIRRDQRRFADARADIAKAIAWYEANLPGDERTITDMKAVAASIDKAERAGPGGGGDVGSATPSGA